MKPEHAALLKSLKKLKLETAQVRLFFLRRYLNERKLTVTVYEPEISAGLTDRLRTSVQARLDSANSLHDYAPLTADGDDGFLLAKPDVVNWTSIQQKLCGNGRGGVRVAKEAADLKQCEFYVAEFDFPKGSALYVAKRLPQKLSINRLRFDQWLFHGGKLDMLEDGKVFNVTMGVDFLSWDGHVFVAEKKTFEAIMNIREGMTRKRDEVVELLAKIEKFEGVEVLRQTVGDNAHLLRRITEIANSGNLTDPGFIEKLFDVVREFPKWGIQIQGGKLVITPDNTEDVLSLLNDSRVESFIREQIFDAVVKKPVV